MPPEEDLTTVSEDAFRDISMYPTGLVDILQTPLEAFIYGTSW